MPSLGATCLHPSILLRTMRCRDPGRAFMIMCAVLCRGQRNMCCKFDNRGQSH